MTNPDEDMRMSQPDYWHQIIQGIADGVEESSKYYLKMIKGGFDERVKLRDDFYWTGIVDDRLRVFDIIMYTEFGTTYNSYVMKAGDKDRFI